MAVHPGARGRLIAARLGRLRARAPAAVLASLGLSVGLVAAQPAAAQPLPVIPRFSTMTAGGPVTGWDAIRPSSKAPDTRYALVSESGTVVIRADADRSMSGLVHPVRISPGQGPLRLRWRWRIESTVAGGDPNTKGGDDYAARVYVLFEHRAEALPWAVRAKLKLAELVSGRAPPSAALNYVWDHRAPVGTVVPNAFTDRARMIVLRSGPAEAGRWVIETRDLVADYRAAFGEDPPDIIGIAIATDTDNTAGRATAWYGDMELVAP